MVHTALPAAVERYQPVFKVIRVQSQLDIHTTEHFSQTFIATENRFRFNPSIARCQWKKLFKLGHYCNCKHTS